jgi:hypothetical protein
MTTHGIYFIANDRILDLAVAFLNSVRTFEPQIPISLIPYDGDHGNLIGVAREYQVDLWEDNDLLARCDDISRRYHGTVSGQYRKLAIWNGPYDRFAYLDVDAVLTSSITVPLTLLDAYDILVATSNVASIRRFVWKDNFVRDVAEFDTEFAANTGFIFSKRGILDFNQIEIGASSALILAPVMELNCAEQPLLNYLIVTSGASYSSLSLLARQTQRRDIPTEIWSGFFDGDLLSRRSPALAIHWAGEWQNGKHLKDPFWLHFRFLRETCRAEDEKCARVP